MNKFLVGLCLLLALLLVLCWWFCCRATGGPVVDCSECPPRCEECPPVSAQATLFVEDQHSTAWIELDNHWAKQKSLGDDHKWNGVMFQLGYSWKYHKPDPVSDLEKNWMARVNQFEKITITGANGNLELTPKQFHWVNVVGQRSVGTQPIDDPLLVEYLFAPDWIVPGYNCAGVDSCDDTRTYPPPDPWNCTHPLTTVPSSCLRKRAIHAFYKPERLLTYWQGDQGYAMRAKHRVGEPHNEYDFSLLDAVTVQVWQHTELAGWTQAFQAEIAALGAISEIRIHKPGGVTHQELDYPPTDGYPGMQQIP